MGWKGSDYFFGYYDVIGVKFRIRGGWVGRFLLLFLRFKLSVVLGFE